MKARLLQWRPWRDLRIVASTVASVQILIDNLPGQLFGTFRVPEAAVMFSIIFAEVFALAVSRRWDWVSWVLLGVAFVYGKGAEPLFYLDGSTTLYLVVFFAAHQIVAWLRPIPRTVENAVLSFVAALSANIVGLFFCWLVFRVCDDWMPQWYGSYFWSYAAARAVVPYFFWTFLDKFGRQASVAPESGNHEGSLTPVRAGRD